METMMDVTHQTDHQQSTLWNGDAGRAWVQTQDLLDRIFRPFEDLLVDAVRAGSPGRVLDVGCGQGSPLEQVARKRPEVDHVLEHERSLDEFTNRDRRSLQRQRWQPL